MDVDMSDHDRIVEMHTMLRDHLTPKVNDHETRIRRLEKVVWLVAGLATAAGSAIGTSAGTLIGG